MRPGEFSLRAGVRLQRHAGESRDLAKRRFEIAEDFRVALRLVDAARTDACG